MPPKKDSDKNVKTSKKDSDKNVKTSKKDSDKNVKSSKKDSDKNVKTSQFVLVVWSKKVRGKVAYSVQPDATVIDKNQLYNPRIEASIEDRLSISDDEFQLHLGRVLRHGTKALCNHDAKKHVEEFMEMLEKEAKEEAEEDKQVSDSDSNEDNETKLTDDTCEDEEEDETDGKEDGKKDGRKNGRKDGKEDKHESGSEDAREKDVYINKIFKTERELQETKKQFENYKQMTQAELKEKDSEIALAQAELKEKDSEIDLAQAELKEKDSEIAKLTKLNLFLQTTLPEKIEETARSSKSNKASEPIAEWKDEVISTVAKLNLNTKQERELKSKYKSSLLARACLTFCFPNEVLAKSVVKGGNQQLSKDDPKLDADKVDDICEFVMARFPESDRKKILTILGYKVRDLKRKANAMEKSTDDSTNS